MTHPHSSQPVVTMSIRIQPKMRDQLQKLSDATGITKSFLAMEAIGNYLATQAWQIHSVRKAVKKANSKGAKFVDHSKVVNWVKTWGDEDELEIPQ